MIFAAPITNFEGFGAENSPGAYFYSQGMARTQFGVTPSWSVTKEKDSADLPTLNVVNFFTQGKAAGTSYVDSVDASGYIYESLLGSTNHTLKYFPGATSHGNGLFFDQKNRLLYATDRYLGYWDPAVADYATGTASLTNGSAAVVGAGTTFTAGMVGKRIRFGVENEFYTVSAYTSATSITLSTNYTGSTGAGKTLYVFVGWTDQWQDLGAANDNDYYRQMDNYEDWVVITNNNNLALLNVQDGSFTATALNLPSGYEVRCARAGQAGILAGLNFNNKGAVLLWNPKNTRSEGPWLWFNANIRCIIPTDAGWIVITARGIYETNGYTSKPLLKTLPDDRVNVSQLLGSLRPQGAELLGNRLVFWGSGQLNRQRAGLWILNLDTGLFEFASVASGVTRAVTGGAIFFDNNFTTHISYSTSAPGVRVIGNLTNANPSRAVLITEPKGEGTNEKAAEGAKLFLGMNTRQTETATLTFSVSVKIANLKRNLWNYAQTVSASVSTAVLKVDATFFTYRATVGDEVTILEGVNAGEVRHITSIANPGLATEQWTLDSALPSLTEANINLSIAPFKLVSQQTVTSAAELKELYFAMSNRMRGRQYLIKFLFENMPANLEIEIKGGQFFYSDMGTKKGN